MPSTMPSPARRMGTRTGSYPERRRASKRSSGVSMVIGSSGRWRVASKAISMAISSTNSLKTLVGVALSRRIDSLCWISGWSMTVKLGGVGEVAIGGKASIFADMKEYQAVILRIARNVRDDEDALTDLLNERSRSGWEPAMMSQDEQRSTVVLQRQATHDAS